MKQVYTLSICLVLAMLHGAGLYGQTAIGTSPPDANAMLDVQSTTRGVLLPRLSTAQQATLAGILGAAQTGMMVTDATTGKLISWSGSGWQDATGPTITATPILTATSNIVSINPGTSAGDLITWDGTNWINMQPATQHFSVTKDNRQPSLAINYCIALSGIFPSRNTSTPFLGEVDIFSFNFPPKGYAFCNGQLLSITQNVALFTLLGTFYGGNGINNFQLPNLQGRVPIDMGSGSGLQSYTIGQTGGVESNTISQ